MTHSEGGQLVDWRWPLDAAQFLLKCDADCFAVDDVFAALLKFIPLSTSTEDANQS